MSLFKKLFGGGGEAKSSVDPVVYKDCNIFPEPVKEAGGFRVAARIEKEIGGEIKVHHLIRADVCNAEDVAVEASVGKAKSLIDEQGDAIF